MRNNTNPFSSLNPPMGNVESMIVEERPPPPKQVDREKTCPLLLRVFCATGRHHAVQEYMYGNLPSNELQIYTWLDATLQELTSLVRDVNPETRKKGTYFDFAVVFPNMGTNQFRMRDIGVTCSGQKGADDSKTLSQARFCIGDFMDISITPPNRQPPPRRPRPINNY